MSSFVWRAFIRQIEIATVVLLRAFFRPTEISFLINVASFRSQEMILRQIVNQVEQLVFVVLCHVERKYYRSHSERHSIGLSQ